MDTDCVICFGSHNPAECPDRGEQHCTDCHAKILEVADHTSICASKTWVFNKYANLYAKPLKERFIISTSSPFRYLKNACWRKPEDQLELYSPRNGAFIEFKSDRDISLSTTRFESVGIMVVVKQKIGDKETFAERLLLYTSKQSIVVAAALSKRYDRNAQSSCESNISLILAVSAGEELCLTINVFPAKSPAREYQLRFDKVKKMFLIPSGLLKPPVGFGDGYQHDGTLYAQLGNHPTSANPQLVRSAEDIEGRFDNVACAELAAAVRIFENCFECHALIRNAKDHVPTCGAKNWFLSQMANVYVKNPVTRCVILFKSPPMVRLNGKTINVQVGMKLFSSTADAYSKFLSNSKVILFTTSFTRIRLPFVVTDITSTTYTEKLILMTSQDRTIVAAHSSRSVNELNVLNEFEHNTPLVFIISAEEDTTLAVHVHSIGPQVDVHDVIYRKQDKKFVVPVALDVRTSKFAPKPFDANLSAKKPKHY